MLVRRAWIRLPDCLLGSQLPMWQVPRTVLGVALTFIQLAWPLSLPTWGLMWMGLPTACTGPWTMVGKLGHRAS
jgi:hypothetical protein